MLTLQVVPGMARYEPAIHQPVRTPIRESGELRSGFQEVLDLLRYDGGIGGRNSGTLFWRRRFKAGQTVFSMGQPFDGLYVVRFGALKTVMTQVNGAESVLGFPMKGDLLGFDGVCKNRYLTDVEALTDCDLIKFPASTMFAPDRSNDDIERVAYWAISREIAQEQAAAVAARSVRAEVRLARFLSIQSDRFSALGYSATRFALPMSRRDIGSHLNITLETVSRAFSAMDRLGIIKIDRREVEILSLEALHQFESE